MENTILNKEKFFALYWGQEVGQKEGNVMGIDYKIDWSNMRTIVDKEYLKLKSLSEISDEDAKKLARTIPNLVSLDDVIQGNDVKIVKQLIKDYSEVNLLHLLPYSFISKAIELGYLAPYSTLTPDQIISYGWTKI